MRYLFSLIFIAGIAFFVNQMYLTSPKVKKSQTTAPIPLVKTMPLVKEEARVFIEAYGTVIAAKRITLQAEVGGRIVQQSKNLQRGVLIPKDELVLRIDPREYKLVLQQRESEVEQAKFDIAVEEGRRAVAEREWKLMEQNVATSDPGKQLALRIPHQRKVKYQLQAAESLFTSAKLALSKTQIYSPFNALVISESIEEGQLVSPQTTLATLVGADLFWVQVSIPLAQLPRITFPKDAYLTGSPVQISVDTGGDQPILRSGYVARLLGELDPEGRMARVLIGIDDPLLLKKQESFPSQITEPDALLLGTYVRVAIDANVLKDVIAIPRVALREGNIIWVADVQNKLQMREVQVKWQREEDILIAAEIEEGDQLITSRLSSPLPGIDIRTENHEAR